VRYQVVLCQTNEECTTSDPGRRVVRETHQVPSLYQASVLLEHLMLSGLETGWWIEVHPDTND
jgi:hypothetical protein